MKTFSTILFLLISFPFYSQEECSDWYNPPIIPSDEPPGCWLCDDSFKSINEGYTPDTINYEFPCGEIENSSWITVHTGKHDYIDIWPLVFDCKKGLGLEMAIFDESFTAVSDCYQLINPDNLETFYVPSLKKGNRYHIVFDGIDGAICEFGAATLYEPIDKFIVTPDIQKYCVGMEVCLEKPYDSGTEVIDWIVPAGDSILTGGGKGDLNTCILLKSVGTKEIIVFATNKCIDVEFSISKSIFVVEGESIAVDTIYSDNSPLCVGSEVHFWTDWNKSVGLLWDVPEEFEVIDGGKLSDDFIKARITAPIEGEIKILPDQQCATPKMVNFSIPEPPQSRLSKTICQGTCFEIGDSCYSEPGNHIVPIKQLGSTCDSIVDLRLSFEDIFPSPEILCENQALGVLVEWDNLSAADSFRVIVNGESYITTTENKVLITDLQIWDWLRIKVQPIGDCTFLPAETSCTFTSTNEVVEENSFKIVPNPTSGKFLIESELEIENIEIYYLDGNFLKSEKGKEVDLYGQTGVFLLKIYTTKGVSFERVLIL